MSEEIGTKKIYPWLDLAKAIGLLGTIISHCFQASVEICCFSTSIFFMFYIAAGYTIKPVDSVKKFGKSTWNDFKKMIVPSFLVFLLSGVYSWWTSSLRGEVPMWAHFVEKARIFVSPDVPIMWFFIALFWGKLIYRVLLTWFPRFRTIPILFLTALCLRYSPEHRLPLMIDVVPMVLIFMDEGYWIKQLDMFCVSHASVNWFEKSKWIVLSLSDIVCLAIVYRCIVVRKYFMLLSARDYTAKTVIMVVALMWLLVQLCKLVQNSSFIRPLILLGKHTLGFIYLHFLDGYWLMPIVGLLVGYLGVSEAHSDLVSFAFRFVGLCCGTALCVCIQKVVKEKIQNRK